MKEFSILKCEENSVLVRSSFGLSNFDSMPFLSDNKVVIITNFLKPNITIYDVSGLSVDDIELLIKLHINSLCFACNYRYEHVNIIGNIYIFY